MDLPNFERHRELLHAIERKSIVARIEAFYRKPETEAAYTRACELRDHYDAEFNRIYEAIKAGRPARLTGALQQAQSQSACRALNLLVQLNQVRALVARDCNHALGEASPYWNDQSRRRCDRDASYETLCALRRSEPPEYVERAPRKRRASTKQPRTAPLVKEQKPRLAGRGSPPVAATTSAEPARETAAAPDAFVAETPRGEELHVAAESPRPPAFPPGLLFLRPWMLVIGIRGSTKLTKGDSTRRSADLRSARRTAPDEAVLRQVRRFATPRSHFAGPGGACFRTAA